MTTTTTTNTTGSVGRTEILPDDAVLRRDRRDRVLAAMEEADIDVLVLGREANARYVSGVPRLWLAGTRPFGASCVLVCESRAIHLLSTWDEGVPDDIPREHLYGYTFNPANMLDALSRVEGAETFRTVATDGMSPGAAGLLAGAFPAATLVDGDGLMRRVRRSKFATEVDAIRSAVAVAEQSLATTTAAVTPGTTERHLTGVFMEAMGGHGMCMPSVQDIAWATSPDQAWRRTGRDAPIAPGTLVALEGGVMLDGYTGELGRTVTAGGPTAESDALLRRRDALWRALLAACRPGKSLAGLLEAYEHVGVDPPRRPVASGLGLGFDDPLVSAALPRTAREGRFEEGMVLAVTASVFRDGVGTAFGQEPIVITPAGPELLSTDPFVADDG